MHRRGVDEVELGPVAQHQRDRVAAAQPEPVQPRGEPPHAGVVLRPRQLALPAARAQRDLLAALGHARLERRAQRLAQSSTWAPITTVRSSGRLKYPTGLAALRAIAANSFLRQRAMHGSSVIEIEAREMK